MKAAESPLLPGAQGKMSRWDSKAIIILSVNKVKNKNKADWNQWNERGVPAEGGTGDPGWNERGGQRPEFGMRGSWRDPGWNERDGQRPELE